MLRNGQRMWWSPCHKIFSLQLKKANIWRIIGRQYYERIVGGTGWFWLDAKDAVVEM